MYESVLVKKLENNCVLFLTNFLFLTLYVSLCIQLMDLETWIDSQRKQLWVEIKIQIIQINILLRLEEKGNMPGIYGCSFNHKLI